MASSILGSPSSLALPDAKVDERLASIGPSWSTVREKLNKQQTPEEREFRDNLAKGYGVGSPLHKLRLFDKSNKESDVRVTLYRDSASWCPYCQKVWTMLEEKRIPYRVEKVNMRCYGEKPGTFMQLQPSGIIPVAVIDGTTYGQSNDIMLALEQRFPQRSLQPPKGQERRSQELLRLERSLFSAWMYWLTGGSGSKRNRSDFIQVLGLVENALKESDGPFFMGKDITIVDLMFVPFLERMCASLLFFKGFTIRVPKGAPADYPEVNKWFDAMEGLQSYQLTKSDYYTHCWDLPPQIGGCTYEDAGSPYERAINGERSMDGNSGSWEFPLEPHNGGVEPDWGWAAKDDAAACREAVERVSANHDNIVRFAARGAGRNGMPPYSAPLADPNAVPSEAVVVGVDSILRVVCSAMLTSVEEHDASLVELARASLEGGKDYVDAIVASLSYLRDRIGVPRDMKLPAARQLRASLNWAIRKILSEKK